ncbi:hypothetical protein R4Y45_06560 [Holzapfeliella sp. He02]|uniref:Uncharacterized protein n=1 Tax=Holzapfeliella saturejae TaxID=3082953 RepID=A0ABU8SHP0_9LACO
MQNILFGIISLLIIISVIAYFQKNKLEKQYIQSFLSDKTKVATIKSIIASSETTQQAVENIRDHFHLTTVQAVTLYSELKPKKP